MLLLARRPNVQALSCAAPAADVSLRPRLGRISERGDPYLRMLLIHGARSVLAHAKRGKAPSDGLRAWALGRERARGHNKAAVALANELARIVWAVWRNDRPFTARSQEEAATS